MAAMTLTRLVALAVLALPLAVGVGRADAWDLPPWAQGTDRKPEPSKPVPVLATSGDKSELIDRVAVTRGQNQGARVAMRIPQSELEPIEAGDRLRASAEVQISTTCLEPSERCHGRSYDINPTITAQIVLSRGRKPGSPSRPLSKRYSVLCKQNRPNRNHHCTVVIPNTTTRIGRPSRLPCKPSACHVNLLLSAHSPHAERGFYVVLGGDRPDGSLEQDKGRVTVIQARKDVPAPFRSRSVQLLRDRLPLTVEDFDKRRIVYSVPIPAPREGEVLAFDAKFVSAISALPFNTFISARVIIATGPSKTHSTNKAETAVPLKGEATESNGFNCTLGPSGFANPCIARKSGAVRFKETVVEKRTGEPKTLYLNVLAGAKPLLADTVRSINRVSLAAQPVGLTVWRYSAR
jgi:hypothetical protein